MIPLVRTQRKARWQNELAFERVRAKLSAQRPNAIRDAVAVLLAADEMDGAAIAALAVREHFADTAAALTSALGTTAGREGTPLIGSLICPPIPAALPGRIAAHFGLSRRNTAVDHNFHYRVSLKELRRIAHGEGERSTRARIALAMLGEPVLPWPELTRCERAGILLAALVAARRRVSEA